VEADEMPEVGAVRMGADQRVEYYDGTAWRPYGELIEPGEGPGTLFRLDNRQDGTEQA
jgi:hypothetical protein